MFRDAEKQFKSSIRQQEMIDSYLWMGKVGYLNLNLCINLYLHLNSFSFVLEATSIIVT